MKAIFNLKDFLTANKETVLINYEKLTKQEFYNGITLKDFMLQVLNVMQNNNPKSEKRASSLLPMLISMTLVSNSRMECVNNLDDKMRAKYNGTAYMAMV